MYGKVTIVDSAKKVTAAVTIGNKYTFNCQCSLSIEKLFHFSCMKYGYPSVNVTISLTAASSLSIVILLPAKRKPFCVIVMDDCIDNDFTEGDTVHAFFLRRRNNSGTKQQLAQSGRPTHFYIQFGLIPAFVRLHVPYFIHYNIYLAAWQDIIKILFTSPLTGQYACS